MSLINVFQLTVTGEELAYISTKSLGKYNNNDDLIRHKKCT